LIGRRIEAMAGYTIVNLKEVEDQAPKFGHSPNLEARFARVPLELESAGVSYFRLAPNFRIPFGHKHQQQEEIYVLVGGSARAKLGDEVVELKAWDAVRVSPETVRSFEAGPEGAEYIAFGAPNTENRDAELVPNWWTD
jgi:mannose-6-phosphate isomerase-like protein (cupin superfamily)